MNESRYSFDEAETLAKIESHWMAWDANVKPGVYVIGISGGIDSTCVAALACKIFGKDRVVGVSLPCDGQADMADVDKVFDVLGIKRVTIDIGDAFASLKNGIENNGIELSYDCKTNMPARLRMASLYGVAQCVGGAVVNTCNLSEDVVGYATLYGDNAGSYAPIQPLTKTEVKKLAKFIGIPRDLAEKTPIDGLQPLTDEDKLGFKYADLDVLIRTGVGTDELKFLATKKFYANKFKTEIVRIPSPKLGLPDWFNGGCEMLPKM